MRLNPSEAIAVVGIGCRFAGTAGPESLWHLLMGGECPLTKVPEDRFRVDEEPELPSEGGFIDDVSHFDAEFFGMASRQVDCVDPQHRLMLEIAYEAIENAGLRELGGSSTGVFIGQWNSDYDRLQWEARPEPDLYTVSGTAYALCSGRISNAFDLRGPCLTVDGACASSLHSVHLACQSLWAGECEVAIAGGVNLVLEPGPTRGFGRSGMLSSDSRCKFADADADGFVRSDGVGAVVLKPLSAAQAAGDRIWAVVRGSAAGNDGGASELFQPSQEGQEASLRLAYQRAGVDPSGVHLIEAHGTGTQAGDLIELKAMSAVVGAGRQAGQECLVGSVKSNVGHCEGAAGVAGFIKVCLCLRYGMIPPTLHVNQPRPQFDWERSGLLPVLAPQDWPCLEGQTPTAGVSAFGVNGSNIHVVLQPAPEPQPKPAPGLSPIGPRLLAISARSKPALEALALRYQSMLGVPNTDLSALCEAAALRRMHHRYRMFSLNGGPFKSGISTSPKLAFVFSGQGSQWAGMAARLYEEEPPFRQAWEECARNLNPLLDGWSLDRVFDSSEVELWERIDVIQPAIFSVQVSLAELLRHWGITPNAVIGHSMGELAASVVSGALDLAQACRVIALRSRLLRERASVGAMAVVELSGEEAQRRLERVPSVVVAAYNSPRACLISGPRPDVERVAGELEGEGLFVRLVRVDIASHSPAMEPLLDELRRQLGECRGKIPEISFYSTVEDHQDSSCLDADYWTRNLRQPVRFQQAVERARSEGVTHFVEISPHAVLAPILQECLADKACKVYASLHRGGAERADCWNLMGKLYVDGVDPLWDRLFQGPGDPDLLPSYPWEKKPYWFQTRNSNQKNRRSLSGHPLLGERIRIAGPAGPDAWERSLDLSSRPSFLSEHRLNGAPLVPAAVFLEMVWAMASEVYNSPGVRLRHFQIHEGLMLSEQGFVLHSVLHQGRLKILSRLDGEASWTLHVTGEISAGVASETPRRLLDPVVAANSLTAADRYREIERMGLYFGPQYRGLGTVGLGEGVVELPSETGVGRYNLHPCLLDAGLQLLMFDDRGRLRQNLGMLSSVEGADLYDLANFPRRCRVVASERDCTFYHEETGEVLLTLFGVETRLLPSKPDKFSGLFAHLQWDPVSPAGSTGSSALRYRVVGPRPSWLSSVLTGDELDEGGEDVLYTAAWSIPLTAPAEEDDISTREQSICGPLFPLLREERRARSLTMLTRGLHDVDDIEADGGFVQGLLWGLAGVVANEYPELVCRVIDLAANPNEDDVLALRTVLSTEYPSGQFAIRDGRVLEGTLAPMTPQSEVEEICTAKGGDFYVAVETRGDLNSLVAYSMERSAPAYGQVEIAVESVGLNFANVLSALGLYEGGGTLALECSGRICALGEGVRGLKIGDAVTGIAFDCLASHVCTNAELVCPIPPTLSWEEAAALPVCYLTARLALDKLARVRSEDVVLIHSASGGVGFAALQLCRSRGCRVLVTAGSEAKRQLLTDQGYEEVYDSRTTEFASAVLEATGGRGVDVVLNTLAGDRLLAGLEVLAAGGVLVDISKRDIQENTLLGMSSFRNGRGYRALDLHSWVVERAEAVNPMLRELLSAVESGEWKCAPLTKFPMVEAGKAMRTMLSEGHHGKIVLTRSLMEARLKRAQPFKSDGAYVVTGGQGSVGRTLVEWLLDRGAGEVVTLSRSPRELGRVGDRVTAFSVDVGKPDQVREAMREIRSSLGPVRGIFHLAGVLGDGAVVAQDMESFRSAVAAKVDGAWNLVYESDVSELDHVVFFSSAAGILGSPAQSSYAASNCALDCLARSLRRRGLPALSVGWGWWGENEGMVHAHWQTTRRLRQMGVSPLTQSCCLEALELLLKSNLSYATVMGFDVSSWLEANPSQWTMALLARMPRETADVAVRAPLDCWRSAGIDEQKEFLKQAVRVSFSQVVGIAEEALEEDRPMREYGLDSLYSLELRNKLESNLGIRVKASATINYPTVNSLTQHLCERLDIESVKEVEPRAETPTQSIEELLNRLEDMSEEEALRLLEST